MFSSDFSEDQLKQKVGHMSNTPTLVGYLQLIDFFVFYRIILNATSSQVMFSLADEYVPEYVDKRALVDRQDLELELIEYSFHFSLLLCVSNFIITSCVDLFKLK